MRLSRRRRLVHANRERFPTLEVCDVRQRGRRKARHVGRAHRALPGVGHGHRPVVLAEQGEQVEPVQVARRHQDRRAGRNRRRSSRGDAGIQGLEEREASRIFSTKRENSERLIVLHGCFGVRRCFRGGRVRRCLGVCVVRCKRRCRAHACDERERKGD